MNKLTGPRHSLANVDPETRTAVCAVCGPTPIRYRAGRSSECMTLRKRNRDGDPEKALARKKRNNDTYHAKPSTKAKRREYAANNLDGDLQRRQKMHGWDPEFSVEDHALLLAGQMGKCAICGHLSSGRALAIDHDHLTGAVRGLLCTHCNLGLGNFRDDPERLRCALAYLAR